MEQFSLEKYLENQSRKITTRYGDRKVRIICTDRKAKLPIVALMVDMDGNEYVTYHTKNGWCDETEKYPDKRDLFFADEGEELTEFEKAIRDILVRYISNVDDFPETIKSEAKALLDLARKELKKKFVLLAKEDYQTAFDLGKAEILKNFPKWKKCVGSTDPFIADFRGEDYLYLKDYVIKVSELFEKLPKEE